MYPEIAKKFCIFDTCYRQKVRNPYEAIYTSNEEVMWVCKEGHIWREKINLRVKNGKGCRACENIKKNNFSRNPDCSLKCVLYLHKNRLKLRWFSWRKELYSIFAVILFI
ncbi:zinc-ribbon domain-containing protein [Bacillus tropicus]|uniref:zinc-ribbon domain-containing protein n=1 Tax=Bacillus tropicus TaxID=2026188 RepID=UPI003D1DC64C